MELSCSGDYPDGAFGRFSATPGVVGGVGTMTTHFSSQIVYFGRERNDGGFIPSQCHHISPP